MSDLETQLRSTLAEQARRAPSGEALAELILAEVSGATPLRRRRRVRAWTLPLLAAAAVVAVIASVVGISQWATTSAPAASHLPTAPAPSPTHAPTPTPTPTPTPSHSPSPPPTSQSVVVDGFVALDATFVGAEDGWALGRAPCIHGSGLCPAMFHTTNGRTWTSMGGEKFDVPGDATGCAAPCVSHIRFASASVGYVYGPDAVLMTSNGGASWTRLPGLGADELESLDDNVILIRAADTACPSRCPLFERAQIGSTHWTPFSLPGFPSGPIRVDLARSGRSVLVAGLGYHAGQGLGVPSVVYRSSNGGLTWTRIATVCPFVGDGYESDVTGVTMAVDGSAVASCAVRTPHQLVGFGSTVSAGSVGAPFVAPPAGGKLLPAALVAAASRDIQLVVVNGSAYRSADQGDSWSPVPELHEVTFVGFETATEGRAIADGGHTIWTTHDAGANWSRLSFSR